MNKEAIKQLEDLCKPVSDFLNESYDPYVAIIITSNRIRLVRDEIGIPMGTAPKGQVQEQSEIVQPLNKSCGLDNLAKNITSHLTNYDTLSKE